MSVPQSAPALGQPAPLRRKFSGHDEKVTNLMQRFPGVPEEAIRQELHNVGGHASKARNNIQKKYEIASTPASPAGENAPICPSVSPGASPAASPNTTPMPVTKEPAAPVPVSPTPQVREVPPPRSAPGLIEQPRQAAAQQAAAPSQPPVASSKSLENLKSRFPEHDHDTVQGALKQAGGHAGKAATILSKGGVADGNAGGSTSKAPAAPGGAVDNGKVDTFLTTLTKSELKRVLADVEKSLGVAPSTMKPPAAAPRARSVEKKKPGASCFKMLGHACAADGPKGLKAQQRSDSMGL